LTGTAHFLRHGFPNGFFSVLDEMALLIAALCHDAGHMGMNNDFYVKTRHPLAIRYNDNAVLESMHTALSFELLALPDNNWAKDFAADDWQEFRKTVITAILATDMKVHFDLVNGLSMLQEQLGDVGLTCETFEGEDMKKQRADTKLLLVRSLIHAADISNSVLPIKLARAWAYRVVLEFHNQANLEKQKAVPFQPFMEPHPDNVLALASLQIGFVQFVVQPFWKPLTGVFPPLKPRLKQLEENVDYWKEIKESEERIKRESKDSKV